MSNHKPTQRILAMALSIVMVLGLTPISAAAQTLPVGASGEIISFEALSEETANREVSLGTSEADLDLPGTLTATVRLATATDIGRQEKSAETEEHILDSGEAEPQGEAPATDGEPAPEAEEPEQNPTPSEGTVSGNEQENGDTDGGSDVLAATSTGSAITLGASDASDDGTDTEESEFTEMTIPVPVAWASQPDYDGDTAGIYTFTALVEGIPLASGISAPKITVTVGTPAGVITAFDELSQEVRWQSVEYGTALEELNLPAILPATVEGEAAEVLVTWEAEPAYDATQKGLYLFTAELAEGYHATAELPVIAVVVRAGQPRISLFGFGGGAQDTDPFLIGTAAQLAEIATLTNAGQLETMFLGTTSGTVYLKLDNDIDLSGYAKGEGWVPIGKEYEHPFKGSFDGGGHVITGLTINRSNADDQGLFGSLKYGTVQSLGVVNASVKGNEFVGGIAGALNHRDSRITNCYVTGSISGTGDYVGGIAGWFAVGLMSDCYTNAAVSGTGNSVGGVAGTVHNGGTMQNCYSTGAVSSNGANSSYVGGVTGDVYDSTVKNCAALNPSVSGAGNLVGRVAGGGSSGLSDNIAFSGMTVLENGSAKSIIDSATGVDGAGKTAADLKENTDNVLSSLFTEANGWTYETGKLPILTGLAGQDGTMPAHIVDGGNSIHFPGAGTEGNEYQISTAAQLAKLAELVNSSVEETRNAYNTKFYKLTADIDLSSYRADGGWVPLGKDYSISFKGTFNGGGHVITGLFINRAGSDFQGLFGCISGTGSKVKNFGIVGADITGRHYVGGVAGYVYGTVQNCTSTGAVSGTGDVGGVAGYVNGTVQNCTSTGAVSGGSFVGGIVGDLENGSSKVKDCYSAASVTGTGEIVGGVAGRLNMSTVENCYATGTVKGSKNVGGVVGRAYGTIINSVALNISVTATDDSGAAGRVAGSHDHGSLANNYAYGGMTVTVGDSEQTITDGELTNKNGLDKSAADIQGWDESFWTTGTNWYTTGGATAWSTDDWQFTPGGLPILVGLAGQSAALPDHLLAAGTVPFEGEGSSDEPYLIKTAADLAKLAELVNDGENFSGEYFQMENDLDISGIDPNKDSSGWVPIGRYASYTDNAPFKGYFDGGGHVITGVYINRPDADCQGLFGFIYGGTVQNLGVINASVTGRINVGGVAGHVYGTVKNCYATGNVEGLAVVGGLIGGMSTGAAIKKCYSHVNIKNIPSVPTDSYYSFGGVVGYFQGTMENCYSTGSVTGDKSVGGVAGSVIGGTVQNCYSTGEVTGYGDVGGVAGRVNSDGTVQNCVALNPEISGAGNDVGRVVGSLSGTLKNNYAYGGMECESKGSLYSNGADLTSATLFGGSFWTTEGNWDTAAWDFTVWEFADGKLPTLIGLGGQSGVPDLYLLKLSTDQLTVSLSGAGISESGNSYTAQASYTAQTVTVTVTGMADWTNPAVTITAKKTSGGEAISVTPTGNGSGTFDIPAEFSGNITVTATSDGNPVNKRSVTLAVNKRTLSETDFSGIIPTDHVYNRLQQGIGDISFVGVVLTFKYNGSEIAPTDAGTYAVILHYAGDTVYNATEAEGLAIGDYKIAPKPVTITPNPNQSKQYGAADPVLVYSNNGGLTTGDFSGALSRASGENVGNYPITLGTLSAGDNYQLSLVSGTVNFIIEQAKVQSISTTVSNVSKTAYEVRNATAAQEVVNMAGLPSSVSVTTDGGTATLPITWATSTAYDAKSASYTVIGTLTGNSNIDSNSVITSVTVAVTPVTAVNPTFGDTLAVINSDSAATAAALGSAILPASGSIAVEGESIAYTIDWNGGETLDRTTVGNERAFTGTISYTAPPPWLTLPSGLSVSRKVTVTDKTFVTIGGITTADRAYDGASYAPSGTVTVAGGSVPVNQLEWLYESTDGAGYSNSAAPTAAGAYKLTISVSESNPNYAGSEAFSFTIAKRQITLTADSKTVIKGSSMPELTYTVGNLAPSETKADALSTEPILACPTFDGNVVSSYPVTLTGGTATDNYTITTRDNGTFTVAEQIYTVTFNLNGGNRTGGGELSQTIAEGGAATAPIVTRSGYTFTGWDKDFTNVASNLTVTAGWRYNGGGGSSDNGSSVIVTPPAADKPNTPTQGEIKVPGTVDSNGNVTVNITDQTATDAFEKALAEAKKNGTEQNGITVVLRVDTGSKNASSVTVNLPKAVQDTIIAKKIVNIVIVVDSPDIQIGMDLATVREINRQAKSDVNITATRTDSGKLSGDAKKAIGNRPVFDLKVNYGSGKSVQSFGAGSVSVSIPYTLGTNEKGGNVQAVYVDAKGKVHWLINSVYDHVEQVLRFSTNHFSTYGIGYKQQGTAFTDIASHWAKEDIEFVASRGLFSGTSATTFGPNTAMTRGMFVTALGRLANADVGGYTKSSFTDVKSDAYYMGYIEWASKNGIVNGVGNNRFAPDQSITREQMAVIMLNYAKAIGFTLPKVHGENTFADSAKISAYAKDAVKQMQMAGVISGKNGNLFDPQGTATRAEVSAVLRRFVELAISSDTAQGWTRNDSGKWMYYENGKPVTGKKDIDGSTYTFDQYGVTADVPKNLRYTTYTVQKGDSFWLIARKLGCTMAELERLNNKSRFSLIHPGDVLRVPEK